MKTTENYLRDEYGPLMTIKSLAKVLDRSPQGLRVSLNNTNEVSKAINATKRYLGKRVYFKTELVAEIIDGL